MGLSARVVIGLVRPVFGLGHVVFTDNFYTSPVLAKYLFKNGTYLCGTMRSNRVGYPQTELVKTNTEVKRLQRGSSDWRQCYEENMLATAWRDKKDGLLPVYLPRAESDSSTGNCPSPFPSPPLHNQPALITLLVIKLHCFDFCLYQCFALIFLF